MPLGRRRRLAARILPPSYSRPSMLAPSDGGDALDEVHAAADVLKIHPTRLNAFASVQTGPLATLVEDRVVPMALPVRDGMNFARNSSQRPGAEPLRCPPLVGTGRAGWAH